MTAPTFPMHVSVAQARELFAALLPAPPVVTLPLRKALGCTLGADLTALVSHPSATESALDGIACREADTLTASAGAPVALRVVGESRAGEPFAGEVGPGECVRIYTGAPLPPGTDAICPVEQLREGEGTSAVERGTVELLRPARPGDVRPEGGDFHAGETVMSAGLRLTPARLALAAALGHAQVPVRRWRVALLSTGDEVVAPGQPLAPGQVYDSNRVGLAALLTEAGYEVLDLGHAPDSPAALRERLGAAGGADLLLTSGGVSMGRYDFMRDLLLGEGEITFWKVKMRPGGPALCGRWGGLPVFGLPGNPVSSLVVFQVIVRPVLTGEPLPTRQVTAATPFASLADKTAFWRGVLSGDEVRDYPRQGSGVLRSLSDADALVVVPEGQNIAAGERVEVVLL
ncbi:molybdopterin molybdotransferase MoeA [Deinococcus radiodurans]|jgi:molybdopterin molybdochelatase|uniref:Molybdopterin molybdenumtransferase n=1 Tax=Deinococcus radiodurans (strain ATCC 13939 / DSM 20539 / JCM 16871 / CCUG 27074 / LMG 4051 / NBRC 15346 / NCIMB 9279 / VKM B-1422 / R1) TaxID=243230 RepID=Q9RY74_DEIRA|nr:gephyrin-like molybdotransferase Glp [Deinococcus radiodurans]AAF09669.1 molybdopterin biosynthesis MoeA [Deinococcus radiodurans R1 = ATCC 13939 = DSM 20539]ANC72633.1 molybdopterin molybdenumtransferase MoeA [Deinococcus radiodurans R1 = ATCC 13939 = DSM 20539]QEM72052.1 molybdopterin molybdenumtransferase MoeA [Deinococcus radiodurans]QIP28324.1 molybdopterin molybdotransferase MoeA [Deinococcus radiodurans]QIP30801.1 molybdopterin molybdotransferase MoeA [Deinococcus radiodurans]